MAIIEKNTSVNPYKFDTDSNGFPVFTRKNITFLQALIENDSDYRISYDYDNEKFESSYAGLLEKYGVSKDPIIMEGIVKSIDKFNATHLASEGPAGGGRGIKLTVEAILQIEDLEDKLRNKDDNIVVEIARAVKNQTGKNKVNFSFATKFCAYTSLGALEQDNYCIYDKVVQNILPYYIYTYLNDDSYYRTNRNGKNCSIIEEKYKMTTDYEGYRKLIDRLIDSIEEDINYRIRYKDFDNLLWYYFKGDDSRIDRAMRCLPIKKR